MQRRHSTAWLVLSTAAVSGLRAPPLRMSAGPGYETDRFAGRYALGKNLPTVSTKQGMQFAWRGKDQPVRVLGGASSEVLGGKNLADVLRKGFEIEERAFHALERGEAAEPLSVHTSAGVPQALDDFLEALQPHLPQWAQTEDDWCVNLQAEGSSAVHAAIDMAIQATQPGADLTAPTARTRVACGASSYHGPASTSPGGGIPLGAAAKGLTHPVRYPVPSPFLRYREESDAEFHERLLAEYMEYLDTYEHELGVVLFEPQWGSSVASTPWPPQLLRAYVTEAKRRGLAVICDEVMCGLGRHGQDPRGATGCFLTECWDLRPDAVTFGKSIGGGAGHLLSGAILLTGASQLAQSSRTALQSHTYAGSSARALCNGAALLNRLTSLRTNVQAVEKAVKPTLDKLRHDSGGRVLTQGQGALWGGLFAHSDLAERTAANVALKKKCAERGVLPYFVPVGGFMLTPRYDDDPALLTSAVEDLAQCCLEVVEEMSWSTDDLLPLAKPAEVTITSTTTTTTSASEPIVQEALAELEKPCEHLSDRDRAIVQLNTAYYHRCPQAWSVAAKHARAASLEDEAIAALARGAAPPFAPTSRDAAVHASTVSLLRNRGLSRSESALALLGAEGVASLVQLVGRQASSALTLNVFDQTTEQPWEADAALLTDAELAALVAMAGAADDADVCLQHGCDMDEAILAEKEAAEVAPELY
mmetsp:Transcript_23086/g.60014  ORF Transcript_23086/g.60014 Transcript_23086/m.60014 type:complete len:704 (+) Transcript_23086:105-2216(+)